jgi:hypothetical protein
VNALSLRSGLKNGFLASFVLVAVSTFAASKGPLELQHQTNVGGKQLASGNYTVQWDGTGDQVELKVFQGKKEVASTSARVIKVEHPSDNNASVVTAGSDGAASLSEIRFRGKNFALQLNGEGGGSSAGGAAR